MNDTAWLPNTFIAGVPKAGTSSLHRWIEDHPDAVASREKEAAFFVDADSHVSRPGKTLRDGYDAYRAQFDIPQGMQPRVILDSTPSYIYQQTALDHIPDLPSQPRCIFVLREPADQIRSTFAYFRNNWTYIPEEMEFAEFLQAVRDGSDTFGGNELASNALQNARYVDHLRAWRDRLGAHRMMVCTFDDLRRNPAALMRRVAEWLGLDQSFYEGYDFTAENETYTPRSRMLHRLNVAVRERLAQGPLYDGLRSVYRRLNTVPGSRGVATSAQLAALSMEFADANAELAREFDLDLTGWALPDQRARDRMPS